MREKKYLVSFDTCDMWGHDLRLHIDKELKAHSKKQALVRAMGYAKQKLGLTYSSKITAENVSIRDLDAEENAYMIAEIEKNRQDWLVNGDEY